MADNPATFVQTRTARICVPRGLQAEVRRRLAQIGRPQEFDAVIALIRQQVLDMDTEARPQLLAEIDFIVADARLHGAYHARRRRRR